MRSSLWFNRSFIVEVEALICATGFDTSFKPAFPVLGYDKQDLRDLWKSEPKSYLSVTAAGMPNYFSQYILSSSSFIPSTTKGDDKPHIMWGKNILLTTSGCSVISGPNFPLANGSLIPCLEANIKFAFTAAKKIAYAGIKSLAPCQGAVDDFQEYKDSLMEDLVWTGSCASWYVSCCLPVYSLCLPRHAVRVQP